VLFLDQQEHIPRSLTGDEAQLCMRAAGAPIGIGSDRYAVGKQLLQAADPGLLFLDDGFQHLQLHRDFDLVLIDALRPFGGGHFVPLGGLREPLSGLARATAFLVTRADEAPNTKAIETILRRYNPTAPIFHARTVPLKWRDSSGTELNSDVFKDKPVVAICGLGNPQAFWKTLRRLEIEPVAHYEYEDHHQYAPAEIRLLAQHARDMRAEIVLTTEKDEINLDPHYPAIMGEIKLFRLEIGMEIDHREELLSLIHQQCPSGII
jgi:tetraacyldisaccharide 4'-kinase